MPHPQDGVFQPAFVQAATAKKKKKKAGRLQTESDQTLTFTALTSVNY